MNSGDFDYPTLDYLPSLVGMDSVIDQDYLKARSATLPVVQVPALPAVHVEPSVEDEEDDARTDDERGDHQGQHGVTVAGVICIRG